GNRGEDDFDRLRELPWRLAPAHAVLQKRAGALLAARISVHGITGGEVASRHAATHVAETDEADCRAHRARPSISSTSSSFSSRLAAARIGSTCSAVRNPTIAPSTASVRSVHATAT